MHVCCFIIQTSIYRYMAEGILCNCLEATSRLQSQLQYLSILHMRIHMHTWLSRHYTKQVHNITLIVALFYNYT